MKDANSKHQNHPIGSPKLLTCQFSISTFFADHNIDGLMFHIISVKNDFDKFENPRIFNKLFNIDTSI